MAFLGWWDGELQPDAWFDAELQPRAWFDTDVVETSTGGGSFVSASTTETATADSTQSAVRTSAASTVEATADPYLSNVKLLFHGEGADDSTTIIDSSLLGSTPSCIGNARIRTAQKLFGEGSLAFDGSNDRIEIPHDDQLMLGTEDFTIEFSVYFTSLIGRQTILSKGNGTAGGWVIQTGLSDGKINFYTGSGLTLVAGNPGGSYFNSVWYRYAIVKNGSTVSIYAGGGLIVSGTISEDLNDNTSPLVIGGGANFDPTTYSVNGYIDEVRITKGVARYTSFYTPVSQPFPDTFSSSASESTAATSFSLSASATETATSLDALSAARTTTGALSEAATASESLGASSSPTANAVESTGGTADTPTGIKTTPASLNEGVGDDFYQNVELLLHSNGANASTTFTDTGPSPKTLTAAGGAQVSTTQSKFGGSALRIGAIADSVNMTETLNLSSGSYTIEAFVWFSANGVGDGNALLSTNNNTFPSRWTIDAYPSGGNTLIMRLFTESNAVALSGSTAYTLSTWAHIAVVNNVGANTCILYINGTQVASRAATQLSAQTVKIGKNSSAWAEPPYYIDDLRITKAVRYTSAFTPPALTFPDNGSASDSSAAVTTVVSSAAITETGSPIDTATNSAVLTAAQAEANTSTDAPSATYSSVAAATEAAAPGHTQSSGIFTDATRTEPTSAVDAPNASYSTTGSLTEPATAIDAPSSNTPGTSAIAESATASEASSNTLNTTGAATEAAGAGDAVASTKTTPATASESNNATENIASGAMFTSAAAELANAADTELATKSTTAATTEAGTALEVLGTTNTAARIEPATATETQVGVKTGAATITEPATGGDSTNSTRLLAAGLQETAIASDASQAFALFLAQQLEAAAAADEFIARFITGAEQLEYSTALDFTSADSFDDLTCDPKRTTLVMQDGRAVLIAADGRTIMVPAGTTIAILAEMRTLNIPPETRVLLVLGSALDPISSDPRALNVTA